MYEELRDLIAEAKAGGLLAVVWSYPRGSGIGKQGETGIDVCAYAAQIAAQLGAHIIKVKPPTDFIEQDAARKVYEARGIEIDTLADRPERRLRHDHGPQLVPASSRRRRQAAPRGHGDPPRHVAGLNGLAMPAGRGVAERGNGRVLCRRSGRACELA